MARAAARCWVADFAAVYLARTALAEVERGLREPGGAMSGARWRELAELLRIVEGAVHADG